MLSRVVAVVVLAVVAAIVVAAVVVAVVVVLGNGVADARWTRHARRSPTDRA